MSMFSNKMRALTAEELTVLREVMEESGVSLQAGVKDGKTISERLNNLGFFGSLILSIGAFAGLYMTFLLILLVAGSALELFSILFGAILK